MSITVGHIGWGRETAIAAALAALALVLWLPSSTPTALAPAAAPMEKGAGSTGPAGSAVQASTPGTVRAVLFWLQTCPHCHEVRTNVLPPLRRQYGARLQIHEIEVGAAEKWERMVQVAAAYGIPRQQVGVPLLIVGDRALFGSVQIPAELPRLIEQHLAAGGVDFPQFAALQVLLPPGSTVAAASGPPSSSSGSSGVPDAVGAVSSASSMLAVPFVGAVDLAATSLIASTLIVGFLDGVNPCSLWMISLLLAMVVVSGSRTKTIVVGLTFLAVAATAYGLFIAGLFGVFAVVGLSWWIRGGVAAIALVFAVLNIKDYFWFKAGPSLSIPDRFKPGIYRDLRALIAPGRSTWALAGATAALALGVTVLELPCTAGLPVLWTRLVAERQVPAPAFAGLLGLYLLMYALDELVIFGVAVTTLRVGKLQEREGRVLKLVGGVVMLALALVLLVAPDLMNTVMGSLGVFGAALAMAAVVLVIHRQSGWIEEHLTGRRRQPVAWNNGRGSGAAGEARRRNARARRTAGH